MIRLGILGSTRGTNMLALIEAIKERQLDAEIAVVITNKASAPILSHAQTAHLPAHFMDAVGLTREAYDQQVTDILKKYQVDWVVLIGYMRILSTPFVQAWPHRIINVHPSLLPAFAGLMDLNVHEAVLKSGVTETGCSVHYVTEVVDGGPIVLQKTCAVLAGDTPEVLKARVQGLERVALVEAMMEMAKRG